MTPKKAGRAHRCCTFPLTPAHGVSLGCPWGGSSSAVPYHWAGTHGCVGVSRLGWQPELECLSPGRQISATVLCCRQGRMGPRRHPWGHGVAPAMWHWAPQVPSLRSRESSVPAWRGHQAELPMGTWQVCSWLVATSAPQHVALGHHHPTRHRHCVGYQHPAKHHHSWDIVTPRDIITV